MRPHIAPPPKKKRRLFFLGAEQAFGSLILLAIGYVIGIIILGSHDSVMRELTWTSTGNGWTSLQFWLFSGLFWLAGGVTALIFWPVFLCHVLIRGLKGLWSLR